MITYADRQKALQDALASRVLVLDGAMGTMLQARNLTAADFGGVALEGCNENLVWPASQPMNLLPLPGFAL